MRNLSIGNFRIDLVKKPTNEHNERKTQNRKKDADRSRIFNRSSTICLIKYPIRYRPHFVRSRRIVFVKQNDRARRRENFRKRENDRRRKRRPDHRRNDLEHFSDPTDPVELARFDHLFGNTAHRPLIQKKINAESRPDTEKDDRPGRRGRIAQ